MHLLNFQRQCASASHEAHIPYLLGPCYLTCLNPSCSASYTGDGLEIDNGEWILSSGAGHGAPSSGMATPLLHARPPSTTCKQKVGHIIQITANCNLKMQLLEVSHFAIEMHIGT